uniref:GLOBIN domain-containing protein n=1 Tax=Angiostrongylus cantonensis TaxID=6313 RepID=A0A0K0D8Y5_ANGCA
MKRKSLPPLLSPVPRGPVYSLSNLFASLFGKVPESDLQKKWSTTYSKMLELSEVLERNEKLPGARVYNMRAYDLVMDGNKNKRGKRLRSEIILCYK